MKSEDNKPFDHRWRLYVAYVFSAWGCRQWEFASIVYLVDLFGGSLVYASALGLLETIVGIFAGPRVGAYIDSTDRLNVMRNLLIGQNLAVSAGSIVFAIALFDVSTISPTWKWTVWSFLLLSAAIVKVTSGGIKVSFHKDWLVVMAEKVPEQLIVLNTSMRRIDLLCSIAAPMLVGIVSSTTSSAVALIVLGVWSFVSLWMEYKLCAWLYDSIPALQGAKVPKSSKSADQVTPAIRDEAENTGLQLPSSSANIPDLSAQSTTSIVMESKAVVSSVLCQTSSTLASQISEEDLMMDDSGNIYFTTTMISPSLASPRLHQHLNTQPSPPLKPSTNQVNIARRGLSKPIPPKSTSTPKSGSAQRQPALTDDDSNSITTAYRHFVESWDRYVAHPSFLASFSYAMLYLSILSLGGIFVTYLKVALGVSDVMLATARGVAAAVGVIATLAVPTMVEKFGLRRAAFWSIWSQATCLAGVFLSFLSMHGHTYPHGSLNAGVIIMLACLCASRFGLWAFDIVQSQIMQETVAAEEVGVVNGTQDSLVNIAYLGSFMLTFVFPDPSTFLWPVLLSFSSVIAAALVFSVYYARTKAASDQASDVNQVVQQTTNPINHANSTKLSSSQVYGTASSQNDEDQSQLP